MKFPIVELQSHLKSWTVASDAQPMKTAIRMTPELSYRDLDDHALDDPGNRAISYSPKIEYGLYEVD